MDDSVFRDDEYLGSNVVLWHIRLSFSLNIWLSSCCVVNHLYVSQQYRKIYYKFTVTKSAELTENINPITAMNKWLHTQYNSY